MAKYLFVYYGGMTATTPAAKKKSMDAWNAWFGKLGKAVIDMGAPTRPGKIVGKGGARDIGADSVTGYTVIKADNLDAAVAMARTGPNITEGGRIAVYEIMAM